MSTDCNYECRVCGAGKNACQANHCATCGEGEELDEACIRAGHDACSGDGSGCSLPEVKFELRQQQPLLESDSPWLAVVRALMEPVACVLSGEYDDGDYIEPSAAARGHLLAVTRSLNHGQTALSLDHVTFLIADRYDNEPEEYLAEFGPHEDDPVRYLLVDVWCAPCHPSSAAQRPRLLISNHAPSHAKP